jgi:hypothetical protein
VNDRGTLPTKVPTPLFNGGTLMIFVGYIIAYIEPGGLVDRDGRFVVGDEVERSFKLFFLFADEEILKEFQRNFKKY